jgi:hypothetical protein
MMKVVQGGLKFSYLAHSPATNQRLKPASLQRDISHIRHVLQCALGWTERLCKTARDQRVALRA